MLAAPRRRADKRRRYSESPEHPTWRFHAHTPERSEPPTTPVERFLAHKYIEGSPHPDGVDRLFSNDGALVYKGEFAVGRSGLRVPHGQGIYYYPGTVKHRYEGGVRHGLPSGEGVCFKPDGSSVEYVGKWRLGTPTDYTPADGGDAVPPHPVSILHGSVPCSRCDRNFFEHCVGIGCGHRFTLDLERVRWWDPDPPCGMNRHMQLVLSSKLLA